MAVPEDSASVPPDSGSVPPDSGSVPPDSGSVPSDTGSVAPDPLRGVAPVLLALIGLGIGASVFARIVETRLPVGANA